jgi:hypothetical protein
MFVTTDPTSASSHPHSTQIRTPTNVQHGIDTLLRKLVPIVEESVLIFVCAEQRDGGDLHRGGDNDERSRWRVKCSCVSITDQLINRYLRNAVACVCRPSMNPARRW